MASAKSLEGYIIKEFQALGIKDPATLQKFAEALSKAVDSYLKDDIKVKPGQGTSGVDSVDGPTVGKTTTPGSLF